MKIKKNVRRICMVSSIGLGFLVAAFFPDYITFVGASAGAAQSILSSLTEDQKDSILDELNDAVEKSLALTKKETTSDTALKILDDLSLLTKVNPNNLSSLIEQTETYSINYCTYNDTNNIIKTFEKYFQFEIFNSERLSTLYVLTTTYATLDKIKLITETLNANNGKLDDIKNAMATMSTSMDEVNKEVSYMNTSINEVSKKVSTTSEIIHEIIYKIFAAWNKFWHSVVFVLVSMFAFLLSGILLSIPVNITYLTTALICYGVSFHLVDFVRKKDRFSNYYWQYILKHYVISILISVSCFSIISLAINQEMFPLLLLMLTIGMIFGNLIESWLKGSVEIY